MGSRVALATCSDYPQLTEGDQLLQAALRRRGVEATPAVWSDPHVQWESFQAVILRSVWDYLHHYQEFMRWVERVDQVTALHNPASVVRWNVDKRYLSVLNTWGVPVVPVRVLTGSELPAVHASTDDGWFTDLRGNPVRPSHPWIEREYVVKPCVSAGGEDTARYRPDQWPTAREQVMQLLEQGRDVIVQPYQHQVDEQGETAMYFFGGEYSHALRKRALLEPGREITEEMMRTCMTPSQARDDELAVATQTLSLVTQMVGRTPVYARVDTLPTASGPAVLECELIEPCTYAEVVPESADTFANAVCSVVDTSVQG